MKKKNLLMTAIAILGLASITSAQVPSYVPTNGLVGWWPFDGNANDESGNGNNGIVNGPTLTTNRFGNPNAAYLFTVSSSAGWGSAQNRITVANPSIPNTNSLTMSAWVEIDSKPSPFDNRPHTIMGRWDGNGTAVFRHQIDYTGPISSNLLSGTTSNIHAGGSLQYNNWEHVVITYDGSVLRQYQNGSLVNSTTLNIQLNTSTTDLTFGELHMANGHWYLFSGKMDEMGYWDRALTPCEISELYHAQQFSPPVLALNDTTFACGASTTIDAGTDPAWASYLWNTSENSQIISVSNSGLYTVEVTDTNGCIGYDTTMVSLLQPTTSNITESSCDTYTAPDGQTYTSTGNYTAVIPNEVGCDSTITIDLTITNSNSSSETVTECDSYTWSTNGQTYTQSGQYTEVLTNQDGCDSTVTLNLTITNSNTGSETVTECDSYTWSTNGQTYTQSGQYTEVLTNQDGCDSTVTLNLTITNSNTGSPASISQPTNQTININSNAQFVVGSSDPSATYQWQTDLGIGFQNLNSVGQYIGTTNDTLIVSNVTMSNNNQPFRCIISSGSCMDTSDVAVLTVNNSVGINETLQDNLFTVFPNPTQNIINVKVDSKLIGQVYSIYDNTGRIVLAGKLSSENTTIELGNLPGGIYMFSIGDNMKQTFKIIKAG